MPRTSTAPTVVLPGVGAFGDCTAGLQSLPGMVDALERNVREKKKPFLGICVGMQLMADRGIEHGQHDGLGWIPGEVRPLSPADKALKIHIWDGMLCRPQARIHPVLANFAETAHAFVHSYMLVCQDDNDVVATVDYGGRFAAVVGRDNMIGTQFHPEKSQTAGLRLLGNFLQWTGESI